MKTSLVLNSLSFAVLFLVTSCAPNLKDKDVAATKNKLADSTSINSAQKEVSNTINWNKRITASKYGGVTQISADHQGNSYVLFRNFGDLNIPNNHETLAYRTSGSGNNVLVKFNRQGSFEWSFVIGEKNWSVISGIEIDENLNVIICGAFKKTIHLDQNGIPLTLTSLGEQDGLVIKLNFEGKLEWAKQFGGTGVDQIYDVASDKNGSLKITGTYTPTQNFIPAELSEKETNEKDILIASLSIDGTVEWYRGIGGWESDAGLAIAIDFEGNSYVTGHYSDQIDFDPGVGVSKLPYESQYDAFLLKLDSGGAFSWAQSINGKGFIESQKIWFDGKGKVYVAGVFDGAMKSVIGEPQQYIKSKGSNDIFLMEVSLDGTIKNLLTFGGKNKDQLFHLDGNGMGQLILSGVASGEMKFDSTNHDFDYLVKGVTDGFVLFLDTAFQIESMDIISNSGQVSGGAATDHFGRILYAGQFDEDIDLIRGKDTIAMEINRNEPANIYLIKQGKLKK